MNLILQKKNERFLESNLVFDWFTSHAAKFEGESETIYLDPKGVPTIGIGHALGKVDSQGNVEVYNTADINKTLENADMPIISNMDMEVVREKVRIFSQLSDNQRRTWLKQTNEDLKTETHAKISGGTADMAKLLAFDIDERSRALAKRAANEGIDLSELPIGIVRAMLDHEFRGGSKLILGKNHRNTVALRNKNYGAFLFEVLLHSNKEKLKGNDKRVTALANEIYTNLTPEKQNVALEQFQDELYRNDRGLNARESQENLLRVFTQEHDDGTKPAFSIINVLPNGHISGERVQVKSYNRDGQTVDAHERSLPDDDLSNNLR